MDVFVGNLSPRTTLSDLITYFKGFAAEARFQIHDKHFADGGYIRYAIATIEPDKLGEKAIKKLNGGYLHGNTLVLREYLHRSSNNERRALGWREQPWFGIERRASERRRKQVQRPSGYEGTMELNTALQERSAPIAEEVKKEEEHALFARKY